MGCMLCDSRRCVLDGRYWSSVRTSIPMPVGPEAPVTQTTLPFKLKRSLRESALGTSIGIVAVDE